jgi:hypothetical protein
MADSLMKIHPGVIAALNSTVPAITTYPHKWAHSERIVMMLAEVRMRPVEMLLKN